MPFDGYYSSAPSPYAYVPVDPFKPSLAFSLKSIFGDGTVQNLEAGTTSLHEPPPKPKSRIHRPESPSHKQVMEGREVRQREDILPEASNIASMAPLTRSSSSHAQPTVESGRHRKPRLPSPPMHSDSSTHFLYPARTEPRQWTGQLGHRVRRRDSFLMTETNRKQEGLPGGTGQDQPPTSLRQPQYNAAHEGEAQQRLASPDDPLEMRGWIRDGLLTSRMEDVNGGVVTESSYSANPATAQVGETPLINVPFLQYLPACDRCGNLKVRCYTFGTSEKCRRCANGGHDCVFSMTKFRETIKSGSIPFISKPFELAMESSAVPASLGASSQISNSTPPRGAALAPSHTSSLTTGSLSKSPAVLDETFQSDDETNHHAFVPSTMLSSSPLPRVCRRCKNLKVKCEYPSGTLEKCRRCDNGGHECLPAPRKTRGLSTAASVKSFESDSPQQDAASLVSYSASLTVDPPSALPWKTLQPYPTAIQDAFRPFIESQDSKERLSSNDESSEGVGNAVSVDPIPKSTTLAAYREQFPHTISSSRLSSVNDYTPIAPPSVRQDNPSGVVRAKVYGAAEKVVSVSSLPFRTDSVLDTKPKLPSAQAYIIAFLFDTIPRQIYLHMLLRLPHLYFARVTRIFEEAEMSMPMIKQGILDTARAKTELTSGAALGENNMDNTLRPISRKNLPIEYWEPQLDNAAYRNLQNTWQAFVDALQKEWKTLNIISVLLLTAILTILQIPSAAADPLTRYSALLSMICALMSLLYGCIYIIRFGTMRKTYKGAEWAQEAQKSRTSIFWNVWVLLAMPATWLAWSMILYVVSIMSFVWRTTPVSQPNAVDESSAQILVPRIVISLVVGLGVVYLCLIAATLRKYGEMMDRAWQLRIWGWMQDELSEHVDKEGQFREVGSPHNEKSVVNKELRGPPDLPSKHRTDGPGLIEKLADQGSKDFEPRSREYTAANAIGPYEFSDPTLRPLAHAVQDIPENIPPQGIASSTMAPPALAFQQAEPLPGIMEARPPRSGTPSRREYNRAHGPKTSRPRLSNSKRQRVQPSDVKSSSPRNCVRLFGLSEATGPSFSTVSEPDAIGLLNITSEEWDAFKEDVARNRPTLWQNSAALTNHSALAKVLQDFNEKLRMRGSGGSIFVRREFTELGNSYVLYFVPASEES